MIQELYDNIHQTRTEMEKHNAQETRAVVCLSYQELAFIEQFCDLSLMIKQLMGVK